MGYVPKRLGDHHLSQRGQLRVRFKVCARVEAFACGELKQLNDLVFLAYVSKFYRVFPSLYILLREIWPTESAIL